MMRFQGKTAVVTGASQGIGKAIADRLAIEGAQVFGLDLRPPTEPSAATHLACDVSVEEEVVAAFGKVGPKLDFLVSNAGPLSAGQDLPFGVSEPGDVANLAIFLLSDEARRITGEVFLADSGQMLL